MEHVKGIVDLSQVNWDSHECECTVAVRQYVIWEDERTFDPVTMQGKRGDIHCVLRHLDGSVESIPMAWTTIDEMLASGLNHDYWQRAKDQQRLTLSYVEEALRSLEADEGIPVHIQAMSKVELPTDLGQWQAFYENLKVGCTSADCDGIRRSPGTQLRGTHSRRCARHSNIVTSSLQSQLHEHKCKCVYREVTVGEHREYVAHRRVLWLCPYHQRQMRGAA